MTHALSLVVFDATQSRRPPRGLGLSWRLGSRLYRGLGRVDAGYGAHSFADAFDWLGRYEPDRPIAELQFWGHGKWGRVFIERESLDRSALAPASPHHAGMLRLRERLAADALIWFRTCETLGAQAGHDFARALADFSAARVAGHTYVIGFFQSGLRCLGPGTRPHWSVWEGLKHGSPDQPKLALASNPLAPNTITCLTGRVPAGF